MYALIDTFFSCSHRAEIAENHTQNLILHMAELECKLHSPTCRVSTLKARALIGEEWAPNS